MIHTFGLYFTNKTPFFNAKTSKKGIFRFLRRCFTQYTEGSLKTRLAVTLQSKNFPQLQKGMAHAGFDRSKWQSRRFCGFDMCVLIEIN
jgi:hypothetical protein